MIFRFYEVLFRKYLVKLTGNRTQEREERREGIMEDNIEIRN